MSAQFLSLNLQWRNEAIYKSELQIYTRFYNEEMKQSIKVK